jgi:hypothetical protein
MEKICNIAILPIERDPLKKQVLDSLYIEGFKYEKIIEPEEQIIRSFNKRTILIEPIDSIEIFPIEKEPLKKQIIDSLYIEGITFYKEKVVPRNKIQKMDQITFLNIPKPENVIETGDNLEILPIEKEPLKKQFIDNLFIEGIVPVIIKPINKIQKIDKINILSKPKPNNIIEVGDTMEILSIPKMPLQYQLVDNLYIGSIQPLKPKNKIQSIEKWTIEKNGKTTKYHSSGR